MQVLDFQTQPIIQEQAMVLEGTKWNGLNQAINQVPADQVINSTMDVINQTLQQIVESASEQKAVINSLSSHTFEDDWNFLYLLRLLFYIVVILKIIELVFSKRKKMDIKERVYRKYVFSYAEMIREFNDEDRSIMNTTLKNTIKNASIDKNQPKMVKKTSNKKVIFHETKNEYIEPPKRQNNGQNMEGISPLQIFLSRPIKIEPVEQEVTEQVEPSDKDFGQVQTIEQATIIVKQEEESKISIEIDDEESKITQSTMAENFIRQRSEFRGNEEPISKSQMKEKDL